MKICYLLQGRDNPEIAIQYAVALSKEDYVVLSLNDDKWRNEAYLTLVKNPNILLSTSTPFAQEGDLSAARCWLYQMKDALEKYDFDLCVNLTEKTLPTVTREVWVKTLEDKQISNAISFERDSDSNPEFAATVKRYFFSTNSNKFAISEKFRKHARRTANIVYALGFRRKLTDLVYEGEPWFVFDKQTAMNFSANLAYLTEHFILSWYPERFIFHTIWKKFLGHKHIENINFIDTDNNPEGKCFKKHDVLPTRKEVAEIMKMYQPLYKAPYDFIADDIIEEDNRSVVQKMIDRAKGKKKSKKKSA